MVQSRYLVVQLIGKGGMGEVYLAVDQRLGSAVALKRTSFAEDANLAAAFEREAKILARLRHPVLPKVSDHFMDGGDQFLVMEHISGDDLSNRLENSGKAFPLSWVMFWADQLLDALSYLHSHEPPIIHRDIKPQNLKLTDENHIVLLDFGLSKDTATMTVSEAGRSGSIVGYTPHFAPMEQIRGTGTNARSDIYSLSATLYQLMTNLVPPDALSRADVMLGSQRDPIRPPSEVNPAVSSAVSEVILKGLEVSQEKRFAKASEMQKALRAAYAEIQTAMSADTALFKIGDQAGDDLHSTTPPLDTAAPVAPSEMATMIPSQYATNPPGPVVEARVVDEIPALNAVLGMEETKLVQEVQQPELKVANIPSEEIPQEEHAEIPAEIREPEIAVAATAASAAPAPRPTPPSQKPFVNAVPKQKSKSGMLVGGLVGLLVLGGIAAGGGWFAYTKYYLPSQTKAVPSPSPSILASPSPQSTLPVLADVDRDGNSNSPTGSMNGSNSAEANSNRAIVTGGPNVRSTQPSTKENPAQTTKAPTAKTPPKSKAGDDRTKILQ